MFKPGFYLMIGAILVLSTVIYSCKETIRDDEKGKSFLPAENKDSLMNEAWQMEEKYWYYVGNNDTVSYKTLWHDDFIGYPGFGNGVSSKSGIGAWIPELQKDTNLVFSYKLYRKAVNPIEGVVIVFYDADEIWTDKQQQEVKKETYKFTHTWKKSGDTWLILGGMAARKN